MSTLRIVTGHDAAGLAELQTIGAPPGAEPFTHTPGCAVARVRHTRQTPVIEPAPRDEAATRASVLPEPGEAMAPGAHPCGVEADAVVLHPDHHLGRGRGDRHADPVCAGMTARVVDRLLRDAVQRKRGGLR